LRPAPEVCRREVRGRSSTSRSDPDDKTLTTGRSKIRQVPDNQEVWIDQDGYTSVIFELTERVGPSGSSPEVDGRAITHHLEDMVGSDIDSVKIWNTAGTDFSRLEYVGASIPQTTNMQTIPVRTDMFTSRSTKVPAYTLIATQTPRVTQSRDSSSAPDFTAIIMTLVRLERVKTDVLITINVPHIKGEYNEDDVDLELGKQGKMIGDAVEHSARIWQSFNVKDWGLFGEV
jgi:hypothetical protein